MVVKFLINHAGERFLSPVDSLNSVSRTGNKWSQRSLQLIRHNNGYHSTLPLSNVAAIYDSKQRVTNVSKVYV